MPTTLNRKAFEGLINEDLAWLERQPASLERTHIRAVLERAVEAYYPTPPEVPFLRVENHPRTGEAIVVRREKPRRARK